MEILKKMNIKTLILLINFFMMIGAVSGQYYNYQKKEKEVMDTIFRLGGRQIVCKVLKVNPVDIDYKFPGDPSQYSIDKKQVQKIIWRTGKIEEFNAPVFIEVDETSWEAILVTEKKEDISGMYSYGKIGAPSSAGARNKKKALYTATIKLQRKAANMKGNIVLITKKEPKSGYGEPPKYYLHGEVYGYNPPPDEDKEVDDSKEVLDEILK